MESPHRLVYFPDCPRDETGCRCLALFLGPIQVFPPPGELPYGFIGAAQEAGAVVVHPAQGISESDIRKRLSEWETWAGTHGKVDLSALKALLQDGTTDSETSFSLMRRLKSHGNVGSERGEVPGSAQTLVLHWARRLERIRGETRSLMEEVEAGESTLKSLFGGEEDIEDLDAELREVLPSQGDNRVNRPLPWDPGFSYEAGDTSASVSLELAAWDFFYRGAPGDLLTTDREDVIREVLRRCEAREVANLRFPVPSRFEPSASREALQDTHRLWMEAAARLRGPGSVSEPRREDEGAEDLCRTLKEAEDRVEDIYVREGVPFLEDIRLHLSIQLIDGAAFRKLLPTGSEAWEAASNGSAPFQIPCVFFGIRS
jgi:hypothetical protein